MRAIGFAIGLLLTVAMAAEPVTRIYLVGVADPDEVMERAKTITSADAKVWLNPQRTQLSVADTADRQEKIAAMIQSLQKPPRIFQFKVRYPDFVWLPNNFNSAQRVGTQAGTDYNSLRGMSSSPYGPGKIRFGGPPPPQATPGQPAPVPTPTQPVENVMILTVPSGKGALLMVANDAPNAGWLFIWGASHNFWAASQRRTELKAYLYVEPRLKGEKIQLKILPAVTYLMGMTPRNLAAESLMVEKLVPDGEEVEIGSSLDPASEFYKNFFVTYDRVRKPVPIQLGLTVTVQ